MEKASDHQAGILEATEMSLDGNLRERALSNSDNESTTPKSDTSQVGSPSLTAKENAPKGVSSQQQVRNAIEFTRLRYNLGLNIHAANISTKISVNDLLFLSEGQQLGSFYVSDITHLARKVRITLNNSNSKITNSNSKIMFDLDLKNDNRMVSCAEDRMGISMEWKFKTLMDWKFETLIASYNQMDTLSVSPWLEPVEPNDFTRKMEGMLNDIFNLLKLMYSDPQLFELHHGSNGSVARFPANRADGSVAGGAAEKDIDDSVRKRAFSSASTAASGGQSPPLIANRGAHIFNASELMQSDRLPKGRDLSMDKCSRSKHSPGVLLVKA